MADYQTIIGNALSDLPGKNGEARRAHYERARAALREMLRTKDPPASEIELANEQSALEDAIRKIEAQSFGEAMPSLFGTYIKSRICIKAEAIRSLYGDRQPMPGDGILGWIPDIAKELALAEKFDGEIEVSLIDWNTHSMPLEVHEKLRKDIMIKHGPLVSNAASTALPLVPEREKAGSIRFMKSIPWWLWLLPIIVLLVATRKLPYSYYTVTRIAVCGFAAFFAYATWKNEDAVAPPVWLMILISVAILFNPIIPIYLSRATWYPIDIAVAAVFAAHLVFVRLRCLRIKQS